MQNENASDMGLSDLEQFYREAKKHYDEDAEFAERARLRRQAAGRRSVLPENVAQAGRHHHGANQLTYNRLNVTLTEDDVMGESLYNAMLPGIVADLKAKGLAVESEGATVVFLDEYQNKDGDPMGVIIQKKDGGYLYTTTDIACAKYRYETWAPIACCITSTPVSIST